MNLNTSSWRWFYLDNYFDIKAGVYHYPEEYIEGNTPYISASNENNGVGQRIDLIPDFKGNCIVTGKIGCTAFYQEEDFCATSDVNVFIPKFNRFNKNIGLFIVSVINMGENYKWSYGRQCRVGDSKEIKIKLPAKGNDPDWEWMEEYIKSIKSKNITTKNTKGHPLDTSDWKEYKLKDICKITYGVNLEVVNCVEVNKNNKDAIPFVSRTSNNNGISAFVAKEDIIANPAETISIAGGGSVLSTFYQDNEYYSGRDLFYLETKEPTTKYAKLFLCSVIEKNKYKYSYGRQANKTMKDLVLKLPTKNNKPDWDFMDNYIRNLPYGDRI